MNQLITAGDRYATIVKDLQQIARANLIFGLHVHVGIPDREEAIQLMNQARYFLPHIYALSVNSPFWLGQNTGFKAYRHNIFERFPRTGIPDPFESLSEYDDYLKLLVDTNCIDNGKKIWWDIRLHPFFNTLEFRICDAQSRVDDTIALAAHDPGRHRQVTQTAPPKYFVSHLSPARDRGEPLARVALRTRWEIDRFRSWLRSGDTQSD